MTQATKAGLKRLSYFTVKDITHREKNSLYKDAGFIPSESYFPPEIQNYIPKNEVGCMRGVRYFVKL